MANYCVFCVNWDKANVNADKEAHCSLNNIMTTALKSCPGWKPIEEDKSNDVSNNIVVSNSSPVNSKLKPKPTKSVAKVEHAIDKEEQVKLFEHQSKARDKFKDLDEIALFFEMGCGKTVTCMMIACDKFLDKKIDSLLVVAPNDVHKQWYDDLTKESFLSSMITKQDVTCACQILGGRGGQKELYEFDDDGALHIVCVNIDTFSTPHKWEAVVEWANAHNTMIVIDEATVIKNPTSKRSQRMLYEFNDIKKRGKTIISSVKRSPVRAVLTGTPVTNGPIDLWAIMEFVKPNFFGRNYYSFMNYYGMHTQLTITDGTGRDRTINVLITEKTWQIIHDCESFIEAAAITGCSEDTYMTVKHQDHYIGPYKHADELKVLLEPNAVFAKLVDCVDMPATNYIVRQVGMSPSQEACYNNMKSDLLAQFEDHVSTAKNKLVVSIRLQQISSGFIMGHKDSLDSDVDIPFWKTMNDEDYDVTPDEVVWLGESNPKLDALMRDVDELAKPILIFTRFSAEAAKIYELLKDKYDTCLITGWKTVGSIEDFKAGKYQIMVANTTKIARGHNLQCAHTTLYYSNTFSMELRQQSEFRTFRIGQTYPCTYIDYVSCDVDKTIMEALKLKKNLLEYIREKDIGDIV